MIRRLQDMAEENNPILLIKFAINFLGIHPRSLGHPYSDYSAPRQFLSTLVYIRLL